MKKVYITFGGSAYDPTVEHIVTDAPQMGADEVWVYDDLWLTGTEFYRINPWLWPSKRGFGWYAWKPFVIIHALSRLADGDIVLYTDADTYPVHDFSMLFPECVKNRGIMLFVACGINNLHYCKRDCFVVMGQDEPCYHNAKHAAARFMLFQKGPWRVQQFLMEWLTYCINPASLGLKLSTIRPELPGFVEHRSDQSVLTLLAHRYGHKLYREACQFGEPSPEDKDLYPTLFHQVHVRLPKTLSGSKFRNVPLEGGW